MFGVENRNQTAGVPQGSIFEPLLILFFVNVLPNSFRSWRGGLHVAVGEEDHPETTAKTPREYRGGLM